MNDPIDILAQKVAEAEIKSKDLAVLVSLRDHPGFRELESWLRQGREQRVSCCCSFETDRETTLRARAELHVIDGLISLFDAAEKNYEEAKRIATFLRGQAESWHTQFGLGQPAGTNT